MGSTNAEHLGGWRQVASSVAAQRQEMIVKSQQSAVSETLLRASTLLVGAMSDSRDGGVSAADLSKLVGTSLRASKLLLERMNCSGAVAKKLMPSAFEFMAVLVAKDYEVGGLQEPEQYVDMAAGLYSGDDTKLFCGMESLFEDDCHQEKYVSIVLMRESCALMQLVLHLKGQGLAPAEIRDVHLLCDMMIDECKSLDHLEVAFAQLHCVSNLMRETVKKCGWPLNVGSITQQFKARLKMVDELTKRLIHRMEGGCEH